MSDSSTKAERLAAAIAERTETYRRYAVAWDVVADAGEALSRAEAALKVADEAQVEAAKKVRAIAEEP